MTNIAEKYCKQMLQTNIADKNRRQIWLKLLCEGKRVGGEAERQHRWSSCARQLGEYNTQFWCWMSNELVRSRKLQYCLSVTHWLLGVSSQSRYWTKAVRREAKRCYQEARRPTLKHLMRMATLNNRDTFIKNNRQGLMCWCHMTRTTEPIWRRWASLGTSSPSYSHRKYITMMSIIKV